MAAKPHLVSVQEQPPGLRGPQLVPGRARPRWSALELWHLLSLDAPSVAALWTWFFARDGGVRLPASEPAAMFVAVWVLYAGDRLLDARPGADGQAPVGLEERHRFHRRHRHGFVVGIGVAACVLAGLLTRLDAETLRWETVLALLLGLWLLVIHIGGSQQGETDRLPKELGVGVFFGATTSLPTMFRAGHALPVSVGAVLFAGVCTLNCTLLYRWEHARTVCGLEDGHRSTVWLAKHVRGWGLGLAVIAAAVGVFTRPSATWACFLSVAALLWVDRTGSLRGERKAVTRRALADLCLLTPLLFLR